MNTPEILLLVAGTVFALLGMGQLAVHCKKCGDTWRTDITTHSQWSVSYSIAAIIVFMAFALLVLVS